MTGQNAPACRADAKGFRFAPALPGLKSPFSSKRELKRPTVGAQADATDEIDLEGFFTIAPLSRAKLIQRSSVHSKNVKTTFARESLRRK
jgi:hypothetical protein